MPLEIGPNPKDVSPGLLRLAIIRALISAPNHSCRYNKISDLVIKSLKVRTKGAPREEWKSKIMHEARFLVRKNILKKYNKDFPRLKLTDSYADYLYKLQKFLATSGRRQQQDSLQFMQDSHDVEKRSVEESALIYIPDLPDIPESEGLDDRSLDSNLTENDEYPDDEAMELIDVLTGSPNNVLDTDNETSCQSKCNLTAADILSLVKDEYENKDNITVKRTYGELQLFFPSDNGNIYVLFTHRPVQKIAMITGYVPFIEGTTETVLRKYGGFDGTAMLCMEMLGNQEYYAIRQRLELTRYTGHEVVGMVAEVVLQAKRLTEIINGISTP